eukprot:6041474-Amphidinium_carterae.1
MFLSKDGFLLRSPQLYKRNESQLPTFPYSKLTEGFCILAPRGAAYVQLTAATNAAPSQQRWANLIRHLL